MGNSNEGAGGVVLLEGPLAESVLERGRDSMGGAGGQREACLANTPHLLEVEVGEKRPRGEWGGGNPGWAEGVARVNRSSVVQGVFGGDVIVGVVAFGVVYDWSCCCRQCCRCRRTTGHLFPTLH